MKKNLKPFANKQEKHLVSTRCLIQKSKCKSQNENLKFKIFNFFFHFAFLILNFEFEHRAEARCDSVPIEE